MPSAPRSSTSSRCRVAATAVTAPPPRRTAGRPGPAEDSAAPSISSSVTSSDGAKRSTSGRGALTTSPASSAARQAAGGHVAVEDGGEQQPLAPARRRHPGSLARGPGQPGARPAGPGPGRPPPPCTASVARAAAMASGCPPNVLPWSPGSKAAATSARAQHAPTGIPLPSALAMVTTSGSHAEVLEAEPPARPAETGLDLVDHEQDAPLGAELAHRAQVVRGGHDHAGLAHDRLDQDGGHPGRVAGRLSGRRGRRRARGRSRRAWAGRPACLAGCPVAARAASVRPWKASQRATPRRTGRARPSDGPA